MQGSTNRTLKDTLLNDVDLDWDITKKSSIDLIDDFFNSDLGKPFADNKSEIFIGEHKGELKPSKKDIFDQCKKAAKKFLKSTVKESLTKKYLNCYYLFESFKH